MEAFDTYQNLYTAFFKNWKNKMNQLLPSRLEADDLTVLVVSDSGNIPLLIKVSHHRVRYDPPLIVRMEYEGDVQEDEKIFYFLSGAQTYFAVDSKSEVWGVGAEGVDKNFFITKFRKRTRQTVSDLNIETFKLHRVMGADIQFLDTAMGIQTCSARYYCVKCLFTLKDLREGLFFKCFPASTRHSFNKILVNVNEGAMWDEKR
jgi:hypothetical protein